MSSTTVATALVVPFEQLRMSDVEAVGGKNASLGEMISQLTASGVRVPGGFATTAHAFREFLRRDGWRQAALILLFIFLYKLGDSLATALSTPFYLDLGYSKTDIGVIAKHAGLWPAVFGGLLGGLLIGLIEAFWAAYLSAEYKDVATFSILILVLMFRPSGLLGRPEVEKV